MGSRARRRLRKLAEPFVVAAPAGVRVRTRLMVRDTDRAVLEALGAHLGLLASADLARRCRQGRLGAQEKAASRKVRKQEMTQESSSRWAGAITRTTEDSYQLAKRNLKAERTSLKARIKKISGRVKAPVGGREGRTFGYSSSEERFQKQRRAQVLQARLSKVEAQLATGVFRICRGGRRLARNRHNLAATGLTAAEWRNEWRASRWLIVADCERDKLGGNETIRWHPIEHWLEIKLPAPLAHLANLSHGRYRLSAPVSWPHRGDEVAAQATGGSVRYDIAFAPDQDRWYVDASWGIDDEPTADLERLRMGPVAAVDLNVGHLAVVVLDRYGNPICTPATVPLVTAGLPNTTRDARVRDAVSTILALAKGHHAGAVAIENLDFDAARAQGREWTGNRPSRGRRGRTFRRHISGLPTAKLRDRMVQMAHNSGIAVIAVDPAYTSRWGAQHWLAPLKSQYPRQSLTGHHAASVAIGRRGLGHPARRRGWCDSTPPEDGEERAADSAVRPVPAAAGVSKPYSRKPRLRQARGQPHPGPKTRPANRTILGNQAAQDRSGPPVSASLRSR